MFGQSLRYLQAACNQKADQVQRDFLAVSEELKALARQFSEADAATREALLTQQTALQERQRALADEVNHWRDFGRAALRQSGEAAVRAYLAEAQAVEDEAVRAAAERALFVLDAPEEELIKLAAAAQPRPGQVTAAGRLVERARTEFDLRGSDSKPRKAAAVEFVNRPNMLADDESLAELEAHLADADPFVREVATQAVIQFHRLRALRMADLEIGHASVKRLRTLDDAAVVPVFLEVLNTPRKGFISNAAGLTEIENHRTRRVALGGLVEWHTPEAQRAVRGCQYDRDPKIVKLAAVALELFPGEWTGPTPETRRASTRERPSDQP